MDPLTMDSWSFGSIGRIEAVYLRRIEGFFTRNLLLIVLLSVLRIF